MYSAYINYLLNVLLRYSKYYIYRKYWMNVDVKFQYIMNNAIMRAQNILLLPSSAATDRKSKIEVGNSQRPTVNQLFECPI